MTVNPTGMEKVMVFGAEVLTGLVTSIVYDGLKRPAKGFAEAIARQRGISRSLTYGTGDSDDERQKIKPAIDDLVRSLGNEHTDRISKFLIEIERSAVQTL